MTWLMLLREWLDWNESPFCRRGRRGWAARTGGILFSLIVWLTPIWIILGSVPRIEGAIYGLMLYGLLMSWVAPPLCLALYIPPRFSRSQLEDYLLAGIAREKVVYAALRRPAFAMLMTILPWLLASLLVVVIASELRSGRGYGELATAIVIMGVGMMYLFLAAGRVYLAHPEHLVRSMLSSIAQGFVRSLVLIGLILPLVALNSFFSPVFDNTLLFVLASLLWSGMAFWIGSRNFIETMGDRLYRQIDPDRLEETDWWYALGKGRRDPERVAVFLLAGKGLGAIVSSLIAGLGIVVAILAGFTLVDGYPMFFGWNMMFGWDTQATVSGALGLAFGSVLGLGPLAVMTAALAGMGARRSTKDIANPWVGYHLSVLLAGGTASLFFLVYVVIAVATSQLYNRVFLEGIMTLLLIGSVALGMLPIIVYTAVARRGRVFGYTLFLGALLFMIPMLSEGFHTISQPHQEWVFYTSGSQEETLLAASLGIVMLAFLGEWLMQRAWRGLWERTLGTEKP